MDAAGLHPLAIETGQTIDFPHCDSSSTEKYNEIRGELQTSLINRTQLIVDKIRNNHKTAAYYITQ
jgi:hypothetical protein